MFIVHVMFYTVGCSSLESIVQIWLPFQLHHNPETSPRQRQLSVINETETVFHQPYRGEAGMRYGRSSRSTHVPYFDLDCLPRGVETD